MEKIEDIMDLSEFQKEGSIEQPSTKIVKEQFSKRDEAQLRKNGWVSTERGWILQIGYSSGVLVESELVDDRFVVRLIQQNEINEEDGTKMPKIDWVVKFGKKAEQYLTFIEAAHRQQEARYN